MVDTPTKVADVFVPEQFTEYVQERTTLVNAFFQSGIVGSVPGLNFGDKGGLLLQMPFWQSLNEDAQLLDDDDDLVIKKIGSNHDTACQHARALVFGATDLAAALAGSDPIRAIGNAVADNWSAVFNRSLIASLQGSMGALEAESPSVQTLDISGISGSAGKISGSTFIDACQVLGDMKDQIAGVAMHSAVQSHLAKNDLITTALDSQGNVAFEMFMRKRVIVDDAFTPESPEIYTTWLFGPGAVGYAEGTPKVPSETHREPLKNGGNEYVVSRRHYVLHPRGISWTPQSGVPNKTTPSDVELADPDNWTRTYQPKNIRIVKFVHKI